MVVISSRITAAGGAFGCSVALHFILAMVFLASISILFWTCVWVPSFRICIFSFKNGRLLCQMPLKQQKKVFFILPCKFSFCWLQCCRGEPFNYYYAQTLDEVIACAMLESLLSIFLRMSLWFLLTMGRSLLIVYCYHLIILETAFLLGLKGGLDDKYQTSLTLDKKLSWTKCPWM